MINLMRFYRADDSDQEDKALNRMMSVLPSEKEIEYHLNSELNDDKKVNINDLKTRKVKSFYKNK